MDLFLRVQVLQAFQDLSQDGGDLRLIQEAWFQLEERTERSDLFICGANTTLRYFLLNRQKEE